MPRAGPICPTRKRRYITRTQADAALGRIWSTPRSGRRLETRTYHCPTCNGWHLTSKPLTQQPQEAS